ncbi:T9SS type A sorting domain-containing protein [Reichenbachiella sp.]|uniref:T9SS type A sorting domain-containing protein n=1 Tax=Reichenbachiella sp. TaxID=2184521 RepID=UPI003BAF0FFF
MKKQLQQLLLLVTMVLGGYTAAEAQITEYSKDWDWDGWKNQGTFFNRTDYFNTWTAALRPDLSWNSAAEDDGVPDNDGPGGTPNDGHNGTPGFITLQATPNNTWAYDFPRAVRTDAFNIIKTMKNANLLAAGTYRWTVAIRSHGQCNYRILVSENGNAANVLAESSTIVVDADNDGEWIYHNLVFTTDGAAAGLDFRVSKDGVTDPGVNIDIDTWDVVVYVAGTDATLSDISYDDTAVAGFDPATKTYNVELPFGTTDIPVVSATATDMNADVTITQAGAVDGTATIDIMAEDGTTPDQYTVNFSVAAFVSTNSNLSDLQVDGATVSGFASDVLSYQVEYPYGTTDIPVVSATKEDAAATVDITQASSADGEATVLVTAQDASTTTYTVDFTIAAKIPSTDAALAELNVDGTLVTGFESTTSDYVIYLPVDVSTPTVTAATMDEFASAAVTQASSSDGEAIVVVTAEDGTTKKTYKVDFKLVSINSVGNPQNVVYVYPNPTTNVLKISSLHRQLQEVEIVNAWGKIIKRNITNGEINVEDLQSGIYFIKISQQQSVRFIKR